MSARALGAALLALAAAGGALAWLAGAPDARPAPARPAPGAAAGAAPVALAPADARDARDARAPEAPPAAARRAVRGRAIDLAGRPVAGLALRTPDGARARTGADGAFRLAAEHAEALVTVEDPRASVVLRSGPSALRRGAPQVLVVEPGGPLEGSVVDEEGAPLAGAALRLALDERALARLPADAARLCAPAWSAHSAASGRFRLERVPLRAPLVLEARCAGYAPRTLVLDERGAAPCVALAREGAAGRRVSGRVTSATGEPVAGASVRCGAARATSDARGAFALAVAADERASVQALAPGLGASAPCPLPADAAPLALVIDAREAWVAGTLLRADGRPAAGWLVRALAPGDAGERADLGDAPGARGAPPACDAAERARRSEVVARTDARGAFRVRAGVAADGLARLAAWSKEEGRSELSPPLSPGLDATWQLREEAARALEGRVLAAAGAGGVAGARVTVEPLLAPCDTGWSGPVADVAISDADGRFRLARAPAGPVRLRAQKPGFAAAALELDAAGRADATVLLARACEARVTLAGAIPGARALELRDARDAPLALRLAAEPGRAVRRLALADALGRRLLASEEAVALVVLGDAGELLRRPVALRPDVTNELGL